MKLFNRLLALVFAAVLAACGGGGGSAGTTTSGGTANSSAVTMTLDLLDVNGVATRSIGATTVVFAKVVLRDGSGKPVAFKRVQFAGDEKLIKISPDASALTDASGVATVQVSAASLSAVGAGSLSAESVVEAATLSKSIDFQLAPANLTLTDLNLGSGALAAYGNRPVSVVARVNGVPSGNVPVQVSFSASCGVVNPVTATTDGSGKAATTYTASDAKCAGSNVTISASSVGVPVPVTGSLAVNAIQASNLQYVSAVPSLIYLASSGAATQALVSFKVVDSSGNPVQNQPVELSLVNPNVAAGLNIGFLGNTALVTQTTGSDGLVTVAVFSGDVPTAVKVKAQLPGAQSSIQTTSAELTVASGRAVQLAASLSLSAFSIEAFNRDGETAAVTFSLADRQGNPVPDGTEINFVTEAGGVMIPPTCVVTGGRSQCSSTFRSQGARPSDGRVSILAYVPGEEDFVDLDFNNKYNQDGGDTFTDMGNAYRDDDENGVFTPGEFSVPRAGSKACASGLGRSNTCDWEWGPNEVRKEAVLVLATSTAKIASVPSYTTNTVSVTVTTPSGTSTSTVTNYTRMVLTVSDQKGNSMATGTTFSSKFVSGSTSCTIVDTFPSVLSNRVGPVDVAISLKDCRARDLVRLLVTSPASGIQTSLEVLLP